jgi:hypothetical protein
MLLMEVYMPVEYGHRRHDYSLEDSSTVTQYTKWFTLNNYEYVIHYAKGMFTIHAHSLVTKTTTKCRSATTLESAYHNAYCDIKKLIKGAT